ncbi:hypothetical protein JCM10296v2_000239 [Rhodotorula toruloides]
MDGFWGADFSFPSFSLDSTAAFTAAHDESTEFPSPPPSDVEMKDATVTGSKAPGSEQTADQQQQETPAAAEPATKSRKRLHQSSSGSFSTSGYHPGPSLRPPRDLPVGMPESFSLSAFNEPPLVVPATSFNTVAQKPEDFDDVMGAASPSQQSDATLELLEPEEDDEDWDAAAAQEEEELSALLALLEEAMSGEATDMQDKETEHMQPSASKIAPSMGADAKYLAAPEAGLTESGDIPVEPRPAGTCKHFFTDTPINDAERLSVKRLKKLPKRNIIFSAAPSGFHPEPKRSSKLMQARSRVTSKQVVRKTLLDYTDRTMSYLR